MISLWIVAMLTVFAVGLGHRASIGLKVARYQRDRLQANFLANAGIKKVIIDLLREADISYDKVVLEENKNEFATIAGISDEESKININTADQKLIKQVLISAGLDADAQELSVIIHEWISKPAAPAEEKKFFKNGLLKAKEELLLPLEFFYPDKERTLEAYAKIKDLVTVYGDGKVNINTASREALMALASSVAEESQKNSVKDVVEAIIEQRASKGALKDKEDLKLSDDNQINLFTNKILPKVVFKSDYFKIQSKASVGNTTKNISCIYDRKKERVVSWSEN